MVHLTGMTGITGMGMEITWMLKDITGMMGLTGMMGKSWDGDSDDWDNKDGNLAYSTGILGQDSAPSRFGLRFQPPTQGEVSILVTLLSCK